MISENRLNFQTQFSQKEEVGSYDNIALNHRIMPNLNQVQNGTGPDNPNRW